MKSKFFAVAALALCLGFTSCDDDDEIPVSVGMVTNPELKAVLENEGIEFDEAGHVILNEKANSLKTLDLTGKKVQNYTELAVFPNLTELDLSDNDFGPVFDFSILPPQINAVDLTGNEIVDFENLVKVVMPEEGGDPVVTNLRDIKKLHIPASMKDNYDDMVNFYAQNKKAIEDKTMDVQMADENGTLAVYNTLRNVPDAELVKYFKHEFPEVMVGDQIDMAAHLSLDYATKVVSISAIGTGDVFEVDVLNFEGVQYLLNNPNWNGSLIGLTGVKDAQYQPKSVMPKLPLKENVTKVFLAFVSGDVDFSKASNLTQFVMSSNNTIKEIDMTGATLWGTRDEATEHSNYSGSALQVDNCPNVDKLIMPEAKDLKCYFYNIEVFPKLKELDMSHLKSVASSIVLSELDNNCKITYPDLTLFMEDGFMRTRFGCSTNVFNIQATKDFLNKYYTKIEDSSKRIRKAYCMYSWDDCDWEYELSL